MKLWRRIVSVLAGTMFAASGVLGVAAFLEVSQSVEAPGPAALSSTLDAGAARTATQGDAAAFNAWVLDPSASAAPTAADRLNAALGSLALSEATGKSSPSGAGAAPAPEHALGASLDASQSESAGPALNVTAATTSTPARMFEADGGLAMAPAATVFFDGIPSTDGAAVQAASLQVSRVAPAVINATRATTDLALSGERSDLVSLQAAASDVPAPVANWSASAKAEIASRVAGHILENDTLNLSLASQALRPSDPASADALNAQLRYRQSADGSVGSVRDTAESARALAQGGAADRAAAAAALNWLDAQGPLPSDQAVLRLRAHAYDGVLYAASPQPPAATAGAAGGAPLPPSRTAAGSSSGKAALSLWMLVGGIGLSLSLVTVDALKGARQRLYDTVRASPGLHVNELRRRLHMSPSSIEYHLAVLVGAGLVVAEDDGRYKRYYANGAGLGLNPRSPNSRNALGALRRPHAVTLVRALVDREAGATARELSRTLSIHESATARRLDHLEDAGILTSERKGRARLFRVRDRLAALKALTAVEEAPALVATQSVAPLTQTAPEAAQAQVGATAPTP